MKRVLTVALALAMTLSLAAMAKPSLIPWFEINVPEIVDGHVFPPTLDLGATVEGMLSPAWFIDLGFDYHDDDLLNDANDVGLGFEANIGFDELATVNESGFLIYGCLLSLTCDILYGMEYPNRLDIEEFVPGVKVEGYVGPLSLWGGIKFPLNGNVFLDFVPSFGMRVEFDINL